MANIGPAMSFFFGFALIAGAAGVASPLTLILAVIAIALLGNTLAEFSKSVPSTGSFITFIGKAFGPVAAIVTTLVISVGYIIAVSAVVAISGGWTSITIRHYLGVQVPWQALTVFFALFAFALIARGVKLSTKWAGALFAFELGLLLLVSVWVLVDHAASLSVAPFDPARLAGGWSGIGLGFPLAVYLFLGWENSAALAEESEQPRRQVPRAIFLSVLAMGVSYVLFSYITVVGFDYNTKSLAAATVPFVSVANHILGSAAVLAYLAGFTSIIGSLIAASNSQARLIFNAGREGLLPASVARVSARSKAPWVAVLVYLAVALGIALGWGSTMDPVTFFGDSAELGTILISLVYLVANLALPTYYWRNHRERFSVVRHALLPLVGVAAIGFPLYELIKPGQPAPYNLFPPICGVIA
jgi:amino acid transporter